MLKRFFLFLLICLQLLLTSSCWDSRDLEDLNVPIIGAYDLKEENNNEDNEVNYEVGGVFPVLDPKAEKNAVSQSLTGYSIGDTRHKRGSESPTDLIYGILQVAIYGEDLARYGLSYPTDVLLRFPLTKNTLYMAVVDGNANDLIQIEPGDYPNVGILIMNALEQSQENGFIPNTTLHEFAYALYSKGKNPVLPVIKRNNDSMALTGSAVFDKDKMIAKLNLQETTCLSFLRGVKCDGYLPYKIYKEGKQLDTGAVFINNKRRVKVHRKEDKYVFNIEIHLSGVIIEHFARQSFLDDSIHISQVEESLSKTYKNNCEKFIERMQNDFKVDCIDINKYALAKWRRDLEDSIEKDFIKDAEINVEVKVKLDKMGEIN